MKLQNFPTGAIDWSQIEAVVQAGETGMAESRTCNFDEIRMRLVTYSAGYKADHWCAKGHILHLLSGALLMEYADAGSVALSQGMSWHSADDASPPHRVVTASGATALIID
jgi:hypothetical protein